MPWVAAEYLLKGIFLGLLAYAAWVLPDARSALGVAGFMLLGLAGGLIVAARNQAQAGVPRRGRWLAYVLFLLLECPRHVFSGVLFGLLLGIIILRRPEVNPWLLPAFAAFGALLGMGLAALKTIRQRWQRFGFALAAAIVLVGGGLWALDYWPDALPEGNRQSFGVYLLLGLPFFYLLTFVGAAEESEVEAAAWCAALALGIWFVRITPGVPTLALVVPLAIYYVYTQRIMPGLRVFKHTLRGVSFARVGRPREALQSLRRAIQLDPGNSLARTGLWEVHRDLDAGQLSDDPDLSQLIDPHLCLERAARLLNEPPGEAQRSEALHLLDLVLRRDPLLAPQVCYWRAVAALHGKDNETAVKQLERLLDPSAWPANESNRNAMLFPAWQMALLQHAGLEKRVGTPQLELPGRRREAIACVERILADAPQDAAAWGLKRIFYSGLTEADLPPGPLEGVDAGYVEQLGLALIDEPAKHHRGAEYLSLAARGLPAEAPRLYARVADTFDKHGEKAAAHQARLRGKAAGLQHGPKQLSDAARHAYFATLKRLADDATSAGDYDAAVSHLHPFMEYERSGLDTLRQLADLHERRGDALAALKTIEQALLYNAKDKELLERRDKYYYSVQPQQLAQASESQRKAVSVDYCVAKAGQLLALREADADVLDWAKHLADLALVLQPQGFAARVLAARAKLRLGDRDGALQLLEDVRTGKPEKFAGGEEEAWQTANRLLGDLYLNDYDRADLAVGCFQDFRKSDKSGADTLYKLGMAYERLGETARAAKFFEQVTGYEGHPLAGEAAAGLRRTRG